MNLSRPRRNEENKSKEIPVVMFMREFGNCAIYIGPDLMLDLDMSIKLAWNPRKAKCGEYRYKRAIEISWNWLPEFRWAPLARPIMFNDTCSSAWTGMRWEITKVYWPMRFWMRRIDD